MRPWLRDVIAVAGAVCLLGFAFLVWPPLTLALLGVLLIGAWLWSIPEEGDADG